MSTDLGHLILICSMNDLVGYQQGMKIAQPRRGSLRNAEAGDTMSLSVEAEGAPPWYTTARVEEVTKDRQFVVLWLNLLPPEPTTE